MVIPHKAVENAKLVYSRGDRLGRPAVACHPERSEGSNSPGTEILRCAQDDMLG